MNIIVDFDLIVETRGGMLRRIHISCGFRWGGITIPGLQKMETWGTHCCEWTKDKRLSNPAAGLEVQCHHGFIDYIGLFGVLDAVGVMPMPPLVARCLRVAFRRVFPILLPA